MTIMIQAAIYKQTLIRNNEWVAIGFDAWEPVVSGSLPFKVLKNNQEVRRR